MDTRNRKHRHPSRPAQVPVRKRHWQWGLLAGLVVAVAYLLLAHHYIYFRIGAAHLPASDTAYIYGFNPTGGQYQPLVYAALGDSLTAGVGVPSYEQSYPYQLAQKLAGNKSSVILRDFSYPGARTADVIRDLLEPAIASDPALVTVLLGTNDVHGRINPQAFAANYRTIIDQLQSRTKARIYAVSIPYLGAESLLLPPYGLYFHTRIDHYNRIIRQIAAEKGVTFIDLTETTEAVSRQRAYYSADLFHPAAAGYAQWATLLYAGINH